MLALLFKKLTAQLDSLYDHFEARIIASAPKVADAWGTAIEQRAKSLLRNVAGDLPASAAGGLLESFGGLIDSIFPPKKH